MECPGVRLRVRSRSAVLFLALALALPFGTAVVADDEATVGKALTKGKVDVDMRYRYEYVNDDDFDGNSNANTIRLRLGYTTATWHGLFALAEFEGVWALRSEDYRAYPLPPPDLPVVADPQDSELNQGLFGWKGPHAIVIKAGRQRIKLDNDRFIGNVGWRQNEQTFDAFRYDMNITDKTPLTLAYIGNVNRIFGEHAPVAALADWDVSVGIFHLAHKFSPGTLTGYAYPMEFKDDPDASQKSFGIRFLGSHVFSDKTKLLYTAEYADQSPYKDGLSTNNADYGFAELGVTHGKVTYKLGYEVLGGDGEYGFQTPLATLHAFDGWTDKFLATPADGLKDLYAQISATVGGVKLLGVYHGFSRDTGGDDYGTEWGLLAVKTFKKKYGIGLKYASYDAESVESPTAPWEFDTDKFWFWLQLKL